jgi:subfamily B ATP-binding cassette protein MsbA
MIMVQWVVNLVFGTENGHAAKDHLERIPDFLRPLIGKIIAALPTIKAPDSSQGKILLICTLPAVMLFRVVSDYLNTYLTNWAAVRAIADLRTRLFDHLQNLSLSFFSKARTGDLIARVINDTYALHSVIANFLGSVIKEPITIVTLLVVLLAKPETRRLTLISVLVLPACIVPITMYARRVRKSARRMQDHLADLSSLMHESFTGNRIIKAYNLEQTVLSQFVGLTRKFIGQMMRVVRANEIPSQITEFLGVLGISLVLLYVILKNPVTPGDFMQFILSILLMYKPIKALTRLHNQLHQAASASHRVFELLEEKPTVVEAANPLPLKAANADIEFENVDFNYETKPVLRNINLTIKAGQMVALVGSSGSGKTTLTNLLLRFYDPQRGTIRIGETDIRRAAIKDLRSQIALVSQDILLFNETIRQNISLGRPEASVAEIETAAKHAFAHDFIIERPLGYETVAGEKGFSLSNGQRQRISIARAILRNAPILVLDEATSALDNESERAVQAALEELMQGRTTICIAHRLSTIQKADLIVVLSAGKIVETGTHAQLMLARGHYRRLYEMGFEPAMAETSVAAE